MLIMCRIFGLVIAIQIYACQGSPPPTPAVTDLKPPSVGATIAPTPSPTRSPAAYEATIAEWIEQRPAVIHGRFATIDTSGYDASFERLTTRPEVDPAIRVRFVDTYNYLQLSSPEHLASMSSLVVRGRPIAFGRPYFNSIDGSYWDPSLVGPRAGRDVASEILRDVLFEVDEVLGDADSSVLGVDVLEFTVRGGQAIVTITDTSQAGDDDHPLPPGTFVVGYEPPVDLVVGQELIVFLDYVELDGLYADDGTRFGYVYRLMPAHDLYYRWTIADGTAINDALRSSLAFADLEALVTSDNFASAAGATPDDQVHPQKPH